MYKHSNLFQITRKRKLVIRQENKCPSTNSANFTHVFPMSAEKRKCVVRPCRHHDRILSSLSGFTKIPEAAFTGSCEQLGKHGVNLWVPVTKAWRVWDMWVVYKPTAHYNTPVINVYKDTTVGTGWLNKTQCKILFPQTHADTHTTKWQDKISTKEKKHLNKPKIHFQKDCCKYSEGGSKCSSPLTCCVTSSSDNRETLQDHVNYSEHILHNVAYISDFSQLKHRKRI